MKKISYILSVTMLVSIVVLFSIIFVQDIKADCDLPVENINCNCKFIDGYPVMSELPPKPSWAANLNEDLSHTASLGDPPSEFSWKNDNIDWTSPVKNQGTCGSCWAFAAIGAIEAQINIVWNNPDKDVDLSEQYVLSCLSAAGNCNGGWPESAFYYIKSTSSSGNSVNGVITESCMPYRAPSWVSCSSKCDNWRDNLWEIGDYGGADFNGDDPDDRMILKNWLITKGPLVVYMHINSAFTSWGDSHHSPDDYFQDPGYVGQANHVVLLVGYKDDAGINNGGYWICKNSWGTSFGYGGFFNIEYGALQIDDSALWVTVPPGGPDGLPPEASFSHTPAYPDPPDIVQFTDTSTDEDGTVVSWWWDFDDGYYSDLQNPVHCYYTHGFFNVTLTVTDDKGNTDSSTKMVQIGDIPPVAIAGDDIILVDEDDNGSETVVLDGSSSYDLDGYLVSHEWDVDGTTYNTAIVTLVLPVGFYDATLTVTDDDGLIDGDSIIVTIYPKPPNILPVADAGGDITVNDADNDTVETVTLDGSGSYDEDGDIVSYEWSEGSTILGTDEIIDVVFDVGEHTITLVVTDDEGDSDEDTIIITVTEYVPPPDWLFFDDFENGFNQWNLYAGRNTDLWMISTPEQVQVPDHPADNKVACATDRGLYMYMEMKNAVDLSSYETVTLSFWRYVYSRYLMVQVSVNGWSWSTLDSWSNRYDDAGWYYETITLPSWCLTSNSKIQFVAQQEWNREFSEVDDVLIDGILK